MRSGVSKSGVNASLAGEKEGMENLNGHEGESRIQTKADLEPPISSTPEGRVSIVRWNLKGLRRSIGP